ncbi:hypothetical protein BRADI_2g20470v3 [Brachypodium distachyon]|uniref:F-box domain-containing protein n=1 Tax=Brachypodium distachyon TaxID=15368 RepID=A0A2K2D9L0_BRADI|nr:hypothetical protein BRADI_2g20470v3 [Brachypodium distachyon]
MPTIDCLKDDNIEEILLRLSSPASLACAALASNRWRRVASRRGFLRRFRACHPSASSSSSHLLVGLFVFHDCGGLPVFHLAPPVRSDPDLAVIARGGDFLLTRLGDDPAWRLRDCHDGLLLLSRSGGGPLTVYDPVSLRRVTIRRPQLDGDGVIVPVDGYILDSLIRRRGAKSSAFFSFRVVSVQVQHHGRQRAVVYDSGTSRWRFHPWREDNFGYASLVQSRRERPTMQAAGLIFYRRLHQRITSSCTVLNTATRDFFLLPWPAGGLERSSYAVGETEHGACCLACVDNGRQMFQLWLLVREEEEGRGFGAGGKAWKLEKETPVSEVVPHGCHRWCHCHVTTVAAGIALVRESESRHFAVGLKDLKTKAEFCDHGTAMGC